MAVIVEGKQIKVVPVVVRVVVVIVLGGGGGGTYMNHLGKCRQPPINQLHQ